MASVELLEPAVKPEPSPETLNRKLDEQVGEVVERAEDARASEPRQAAEWFYRVPFAGVRYYSF